MTKVCESCHTSNRDRALYCRGCAARFEDVPLPANDAGEAEPAQWSAAAASVSAFETSPRPSEPTRPGATAGARQKSGWLGLLLPAGAVLSTALVAWILWSRPNEVRSHPTQELAQASPARTQLPTKTAPPPTPEQQTVAELASPAQDSEADFSIAPEPKVAQEPKESILALTLERSGTGRAPSNASWVTEQPIQDSEPAQTTMNPPTSSSDGLSKGETVIGKTRTTPARSTPQRRAFADSSSVHRASLQRFYGASTTALNNSGPCDRYNPYGEVPCAYPSGPRRAYAQGSRQVSKAP